MLGKGIIAKSAINVISYLSTCVPIQMVEYFIGRWQVMQEVDIVVEDKIEVYTAIMNVSDVFRNSSCQEKNNPKIE